MVKTLPGLIPHRKQDTMIIAELSNSVNKTEQILAAQAAEQATWNADFAAGQRHFWKGDSLMYCANGGERAGYWDAAETAHAETQRQREHGNDVRSLGI